MSSIVATLDAGSVGEDAAACILNVRLIELN
jgi:hypothetical protein